MDLNRENIRKIRGLIVFAAVIMVVIWQHTIIIDLSRFLMGLVLPFVIGGSIAFVLNMPMSFIERVLFNPKRIAGKKILVKMARPVSLLLAIFSVLGVFALIMLVVIPQLGRTFMDLGRSAADFIPQVQDWIQAQFRNYPDLVYWVNNLEMDWESIIASMITFFQEGAGNFFSSTVAAVTSIVSGAITALISFVFSIYVLHQKERLNEQKRKVMYAFLPKERVEKILEIGYMSYKTFTNFVTGQCLEALILGTVFFIFMNIFRLPFPLLISILIAFCSLIPMFGTFIGFAIGVFLIFMENPIQALIFAIMFIILQQAESSFLYPRVMGKTVGLPSIWVLAAVTLGASIMGFIGMLIAIPIVSVSYTLFRATVYKRLDERKIDVAKEMEKGKDKEKDKEKQESIIKKEYLKRKSKNAKPEQEPGTDE